MISSKFRNESIDNINLSVFKSAIQKYIRRSNKEKALICIDKLSLFFNDEQETKRISTNILHRLMIIFLEDVGIEGLQHWDQIDYYLLENRKNIDGLKNVVDLISDESICKSRICSHLRAFYNDKNRDKYTYYEHKDIIIEFFESKDPFKLLETKFNYSKNDRLLTLAKKWYKELKNVKESFLCWSILLAKELFLPSFTLLPVKTNFNKINIKNINPVTLDFFDDYIFDKHTKEKETNYSDEYFGLISSKVYPESKYVDLLLKTIYINSKIKDPTLMKKESNYGNFKFRFQLTTSKQKTDVYLIEKKKNKLYILKGPFGDKDKIEKYIEYQDVKKNKYNMNVTKNKIIYLIPDRWKTVPLGIRNTLEKDIFYPFLLSKSIIQDITEFKLKIHESKLWPKTEVLDYKETNLHLKDFEKDLNTKDLIVQFLNILGFRCKKKLSDIALRNIILYDKKLYSIDEESVNDNFSLENELKKNNFNIVKNIFFKKYKKDMNQDLRKYLEKHF